MFWVIDQFNDEPTETQQPRPQSQPRGHEKPRGQGKPRWQEEPHESRIYYKLNFDKIKKGCDELWFGDTKVETNVTPRNMVINDSEPFHFVQLLYIIKEKSWENNNWLVFREDELINWVKSNCKIYLENDRMFGKEFYYQFQTMIKYFINNYCDEFMLTQNEDLDCEPRNE